VEEEAHHAALRLRLARPHPEVEEALPLQPARPRLAAEMVAVRLRAEMPAHRQREDVAEGCP